MKLKLPIQLYFSITNSDGIISTEIHIPNFPCRIRLT